MYVDKGPVRVPSFATHSILKLLFQPFALLPRFLQLIFHVTHLFTDGIFRGCDVSQRTGQPNYLIRISSRSFFMVKAHSVCSFSTCVECLSNRSFSSRASLAFKSASNICFLVSSASSFVRFSCVSNSLMVFLACSISSCFFFPSPGNKYKIK